MRIHVAAAPPSHLADTSADQGVGSKPVGLWWANGADWLTWCANEMPAKVTPHIYSVDPGDGANLAVLKSAEDLRAFTESFVAEPLAGQPWHRAYYLDWARVAAEYDGLDVRDLVAWKPKDAAGHTYGLMPMWLHGLQKWDMASGCLWRPNPRTRLEPVSLDLVHGWFNAAEQPIPPALQRASLLPPTRPPAPAPAPPKSGPRR